jgi:signal transduction histidine kinase
MSTAERVQRLERLLEVTRNLSTALETEPFLQTVIAIASELTASEVASILELDETGNQLQFIAMPWFHRDALQAVKVPLEKSIAGWVYQKGQPLIVQDASSDPRFYKAVDHAAGFETHSILAVPLFFKGQPIGVLEAVNKMNNTNYTEEDVTILETLASQAAITIQNSILERRLQTAYDELAQLDRLKNDFVAITSHELRTPLGLILGHATFLREIADEKYHEQLDVIIRNATRLKEIIDSLANVDNYQSGTARVRSRSVSIVRIIEEVVVSFQDEAQQKQVTLQMDAGKDGLLVEGDARKIAIALSNLVKNAITFTNSGGHVFVTAEQVPGYVKVSVIDDGIGIPAQDLPYIFGRFFQVESHLTRKHSGMGLGLSIAKIMIELHGGRIWVESVEGKGSNFIFLLPLNPAQADAAERVFLH